MIIAGAKCDKCGRVEVMEYTSEAIVEVMLRQKGWVIKDKKSICRVCSIKDKEPNKQVVWYEILMQILNCIK